MTYQKNKTLGAFMIGIVTGAGVASVVFALARLPQDIPPGRTLDALLQIHSLYAWRISAVVGPVLLVAACASAIRGRLRRAAWLVLGWAVLEFLADIVLALRYWP